MKFMNFNTKTLMQFEQIFKLSLSLMRTSGRFFSLEQFFQEFSDEFSQEISGESLDQNSLDQKHTNNKDLEKWTTYFPMWIRSQGFAPALSEVAYYESIRENQRRLRKDLLSLKSGLGLRLNPSLQSLEIESAASILGLENGTYLFYVSRNESKMRKADTIDLNIIKRLEEEVVATTEELQLSFDLSRLRELLGEGLVVDSSHLVQEL